MKKINEENTYDIRELKHLRNENPYTIIIGHIKTNSIRNKFESLIKSVSNNLGIIMVSETKNDDTFPESLLFLSKVSQNLIDLTVKLRVQECGNFTLDNRSYKCLKKLQ